MKSSVRRWSVPFAVLPLAGLLAAAGARSEEANASDLVDAAVVANAVEGTVTLIDVGRMRIVRTLDIAPDGKKVGPFRDFSQWLYGQKQLESLAGLNYVQDTDVSPDGRTLYVARGHLGDVAALDLATGELVWRRSVDGPRADHMTMSPDGRRLYVSDMFENEVVVLDTARGRPIADFEGGVWTHDNHVTSDGKRVLNASIGDVQAAMQDRSRPLPEEEYLLTVADALSGRVLETHVFPYGIRPFVLAPGEERVYLQPALAHAIVDYSLRDREIVGRLDLPVKPGVTGADWDFDAPHHGLALSDEEDILCAAGRASDYAALVGTAPLELLATVPTGDAPSWAATSAGGHYCLLPNTRSDDVSVVSYAQRREIARLPAGRGAKHVTTAMIPAAVLYDGESDADSKDAGVRKLSVDSERVHVPVYADGRIKVYRVSLDGAEPIRETLFHVHDRDQLSILVEASQGTDRRPGQAPFHFDVPAGTMQFVPYASQDPVPHKISIGPRQKFLVLGIEFLGATSSATDPVLSLPDVGELHNDVVSAELHALEPGRPLAVVDSLVVSLSACAVDISDEDGAPVGRLSEPGDVLWATAAEVSLARVCQTPVSVVTVTPRAHSR